MDIPPTAAEYASAEASDANRKAQAALDKSKELERKVDEIHLMCQALLMGLFKPDSIKHWLKAAKESNGKPL